jgi:O-antigen ligase
MKLFGRLLVALLAWGALAFGAVYPWAYWPLAAGAVALGVWGLIATEPWRDPRVMGLGAALGAVALAIAVQLVPWPHSVVSTVSPGVDHFLGQFQVGYQPPGFQPLSIAPQMTWVALALYCALAVLLIGLIRGIREAGLDWLVNQVMGLGVALALIGIIQKAFIDEVHPLVYGVWQPLQGGRVFGPFINRNHFAGWMVMVLPVILGYSCTVMQDLPKPRTTDWRGWLHWAVSVEANRFVLVAVAVVVMGTALVLTGSRSGMVAFVIAVAVIAGFVLMRAKGLRFRVAAGVYFLALIVGAAAWAGLGGALDRFRQAPESLESRVGAWGDTIRIIEDFPFAGTGLGTYGRAMLVYQTGRRELIYVQAHNDYLQLAAEGGALVVVPVAVVLAILVRRIRRRLGSPDDDSLSAWVRVGAVAGLVGIGAQSLMEFSLQMPGNALMFSVLVALAMHRPRRVGRAHRV